LPKRLVRPHRQMTDRHDDAALRLHSGVCPGRHPEEQAAPFQNRLLSRATNKGGTSHGSRKHSHRRRHRPDRALCSGLLRTRPDARVEAVNAEARSGSAPWNRANPIRDQDRPPRPARHPPGDARPDCRDRPLGDDSRDRSACRPRSSCARARSAQSCTRSRPGPQRGRTPGRPGACECRTHVPARSVSPAGLGGDVGDAKGAPSLHPSAGRRGESSRARGGSTAEERDTRGARGRLPDTSLTSDQGRNPTLASSARASRSWRPLTQSPKGSGVYSSRVE
jgi:hypothetical protein